MNNQHHHARALTGTGRRHIRVLLIAVWMAAACLMLLTTAPVARAESKPPTTGAPPDGGSTKDPEIVGGTTASAGEYPYQVALVAESPSYEEVGFCGGSLIAPKVVLTAAHCVLGTLEDLHDETGENWVFKVQVGTNSLSSGGQRIAVTRATMHPAYDDAESTNDYAIFELATPAAPAPVAYAVPGQESYTAAGTMATITGWGATSEGGNGSNSLREAQVPIIGDQSCANALGVSYPSAWPTTWICAGFLATGGVDTCQGDSGGPMVVPGPDGRRLLVGVTSWGNGCARRGEPGVYSRVDRVTNWISSFVPKPVVTSVSPATGSAAGGTTVTITGTGLSAATAVKFGTASATFTQVSDTSITATSPAGSVGPVSVRVTTSAGTSPVSAGSTYTYNTSPGGGPTTKVAIGDAARAEGNSSKVSSIVPITLNTPQTSDVYVTYTVAGTTAAAGTDYVQPSKPVTKRIPAGKTYTTATISVVGDTASEGDEQVALTITGVTGGNGPIGIADNTGLLTIRNDDPAGTASTVSLGDVSIHECRSGTVTASLTLMMSKARSVDTTFTLTTGTGTATSGTDYTAKINKTLKVTAGKTSANFTVVVKCDAIVEGNETIPVQIVTAPSHTITDGTGVITVVNAA